MKYLRIKYTFICLLFFANNFAQKSCRVEGQRTKDILEYVVDSLVVGDVIYPNSKTISLIESKTGFVYDSITRQLILNALKELTTEKESLEILASASNQGLITKDMITNNKFLIIDTCPSKPFNIFRWEK